MAVDPNKGAWVQRALGVTVAGAGLPTEPLETISPVRLGKCRLIWGQNVQNIHRQVQALKASVLAALQASNEYDDDEMEEVDEAMEELDEMVSGIDESLVDLVDDVINAEPGPERLKAQRAAIAKADELTKYVNSDPDFALVDQNEYLATNVKATTLSSLGVIRKELMGV